MSKVYFYLRKIIWILLFKLKHSDNPFLIATSYEHRHLSKLSLYPSLVLDIGFNKGQFSSFCLAIWPSCSLIAFDAHPYCSDYSASRLFSAYPRRFQFIRCLLDSSNNERTFNIASSDDNSSALTPTLLNNSLFSRTRIQSSIRIHSKPLSSFSVFNNCSSDVFIKIDVQGSEMDVLKGISSIQYRCIRWIYIEVTDLPLYEGQASRSDIYDFLSDKGFSLHSIHNSHYSGMDLIYSDFLFFRN